jgi:glucose/arabinose dehydrogenase
MKKLFTLAVAALALGACDDDENRLATEPEDRLPALQLQPSENFPTILIPRGFEIEKVAEGLSLPASLTFDEQGRMFVTESSAGFTEEPAPARIVQIENGRVVPVVNLEGEVRGGLIGIVFHQGAFFVSHRDPQDRTGAVSRVTPDGQVTRILTGILDSQAEHQVNQLLVRNGQMFLATGPATNSGVVGLDNAPSVALSPNLSTTPCRDLVLTGVNYVTPDFRTEAMGDLATTGPFMPFGTPAPKGTVVKGVNKCGGSILVFDPNNAEQTVRPFASGLRNAYGLAMNRETGEMFVAVNGFDVRGSRPFQDDFDPIYRVREGAFYGYPDFSAAFEPAILPKFDVPNSLQAKKILLPGGEPLTQDRLHFVIDHEASGITLPDPSLIAGLTPVNASPSGLDVATSAFGNFAGQLFVAEFGDLGPPTNPLINRPRGFRVSVVDPETRRVETFLRNAQPGPASAQGPRAAGLERPVDVTFGPDGAMYILDYGVARPSIPEAKPGDYPFLFVPNTGIVWRVTRTGT